VPPLPSVGPCGYWPQSKDPDRYNLLTAAGIRRAFERPDRLGETAGRDLSQRTLSEARHDRINPSKNTRRHSALSVHAWVSRCSSSATMVLGLNGVQNGPGPFNGFVRTLEDAKAKFAAAWGAWLKAAGLNEDTPTAQLKNPESG
jgi:hypothetical protein